MIACSCTTRRELDAEPNAPLFEAILPAIKRFVTYAFRRIRRSLREDLIAEAIANAYAAFVTNQKIVGLYTSGYLDQARQSLQITTYVYQRGAGSLLDLLDAERTYRSTELAYRDALAAYMTSLKQLNFAVGKQVIP